jgi:hypothetical protein
MLNHIKAKIPHMRNMLEQQLHICSKDLDDIGRKESNSNEIALRDFEKIASCLDETYNDSLPNFRRLADQMADNIFNIKMEPLGLIDFKESKASLNGTPTPEHYVEHVLALEVKYISEECRGMINIPFVGMEKELEHWIHQFVGPCELFIKQYVEDLFKAFKEQVIPKSLQEGSSKSTKQVMKKMENDVLGGTWSKARQEALTYTTKLVASVKENKYTTNQHYLNECASSMKISISIPVNASYRADMLPYYENVCEIQAFLKTRKKILPDTLQLHLSQVIKSLYQESKLKIREYMIHEQTLKSITEPKSLVEMRKFNLNREKQIQGALNEISRFY